MAEHNDSSVDVPEVDATNPERSGRALRGRRFPMAKKQKRDVATIENRASRRSRRRVHPVRSTFTVAAVVGLVATVAIPAFAAVRGTSADAMTLQQVAANNAQSIVVASEVGPASLDRSGFTATTPEEIKKKKDEEAAAKAAAEALANRISASSSTASSSTSYSQSIPLVAPGSGLVRRPLMSFNNFGTPYAGHRGTDYMADRGTPIYSVADGTVVASSESGPGWGVYVKVAHNINGTNVTSLYAHMDWGTRAVQVGDTVSAGQLLGQVGDTGRAFGTHLHLEIVVDGAYMNAESWLVANAG
ncbi:M23 family metallopeptidase [Microbacterium sp. NE2HP2]|uniref:M23 family metallopeptidase n=1 Tax=Microbacterium TaxID=33882 RepID=UPI000DCE8E53|nr:MULTISPECIES: M23 family metallopeptidase [Microbacterium]MCZ4067830.1 M23 family metallopeptidase [Microbacterium sp. H37-C3]MDD7944747.1 M23 family metallopeptidase [Microbacterium plantarum]RAZ31333.1 M23 family peptidase [Microbacterium sp. SMR1]WHE35098.1 M23 family metallopeptidase [Microbacterium sp. BDGP8]WRK16259.1 M23 family metallopeptidase [Microbacterium plantarum]